MTPEDEMLLSIVEAAYDATRMADGKPQFAEAGFTLGHARKIAEAAFAAAGLSVADLARLAPEIARPAAGERR